MKSMLMAVAVGVSLMLGGCQAIKDKSCWNGLRAAEVDYPEWHLVDYHFRFSDFYSCYHHEWEMKDLFKKLEASK